MGKAAIIALIFLAVLIITDIILGTYYGTPAWLIVVFVAATIILVFYIIGVLLRMRINKRTPENPVLTDLEDIDKKTEENKNEMNRVIGQINAVFKDMNSY